MGINDLTEKERLKIFGPVEIQEGENGCHLWKGRGSKYGHVWFRGKPWGVHRLVYFLRHGDIPEGLMVCHHCDNPRCLRDDHHFIGDGSKNMLDCSSKGRLKPCRLIGEMNHKSKTGDEIVSEIRRRHSNGEMQKDLAVKFGITPTQVGRIVRKECWSHIP